MKDLSLVPAINNQRENNQTTFYSSPPFLMKRPFWAAYNSQLFGG
jgi:hypothetical protein